MAARVKRPSTAASSPEQQRDRHLVDLTDTTGWDDTLTVSGISAPTKIVCTIVIDP